MKLRKLLVIVCVCTLVLGLFGLNAFAAADEEPYVVTTEAELTEALAAGGNIKLGANITATAGYTIASGKAVVLDLSEYTLDMGSYYVANNGAFELRGETGGTITGSGAQVIYNVGVLTLTSGTVSNSNMGFDIFSAVNNKIGGEFIMTGGEVIAGVGILNLGDATVSGGTISTISTPAGGCYGILNSGGTVTVSGDAQINAVNPYDHGIYHQSGKVDLMGGKFNATSMNASNVLCASGSVADFLVPGYLYYDENGEVISELTLELGGIVTVAPCQSHAFVDSVCTICAYTCTHSTHNDAGVCDVCQKQRGYSVTVGDSVSYFDDMIQAFDGAKIGTAQAPATIKLLTNVTHTTQKNGVVANGACVVLDLNGKTLTFDNSDNCFYVSSGGKLTLTDSSEGETGVVDMKKGKICVDGAQLILDGGKLIAYGGQYGLDPVIEIVAKSTLVQNGGWIESHGYEAAVEARSNSSYTQNNGTVSAIGFNFVKLNASEYILHDGSLIYETDEYSGGVAIILAMESNSTAVINGGEHTVNGIVDIFDASDGSKVTINGGTFKAATRSTVECGIIKSPNAVVEYKGGIFENGLCNSGNTVQTIGDMPAPGYVYYDENGNIITLTEGMTELMGKITVAECDHRDCTYSASGNVITETCNIENCSHSATATIIAPANAVYDSASNAATVAYSDGWAGNEPTMSYSGTANDGTTYTGVPVKAGEAVASITVSGMTASVNYTVAKATNEWTEDPDIVGWKYGELGNYPTAKAKFGDNGDVSFSYRAKGTVDWAGVPPTDAGIYEMRARIQASDNWELLETTIEFEIKKATPTADIFDFTPPANLDVCDGSAKEAAVTVKEGIEGVGSITIKYFKDGEPLDGAPTAVGTYTVKITVAEGANYLAADDLTVGTFTVDITDETAHTGVMLKSNGNGTHDKVCSVCEKVIESDIACSGTTTDDCDKGYKCACGGYFGTAVAHTPGEDDGDCTTDDLCSVCGALVVAGSESHTGGTATCTEQAECAVCGTAYGELGDHSYGEDGKCVCGAEEPAKGDGEEELGFFARLWNAIVWLFWLIVNFFASLFGIAKA